jgi:hypothetical protein
MQLQAGSSPAVSLTVMAGSGSGGKAPVGLLASSVPP